MMLTAVAFLPSCQKEFEVVNDLNVSSRTLELKSEAVATKIIVYANGPWTVRFAEPVEWACLDKLSGDGLNDIQFSYSTNFGVKRGVDIVLERDGSTETISIIQAGAITSPNMTFDASKVVLPKQSATFTMPMQTNLGFCLEEIKAKVAYYNADGQITETLEIGSPEGKNAWISAYTVSNDKVTFDMKENSAGA
jgi:hypothetical protein